MKCQNASLINFFMLLVNIFFNNKFYNSIMLKWHDLFIEIFFNFYKISLQFFKITILFQIESLERMVIIWLVVKN